ncbi:DCC1-like thiol-disulfide oxidoreductase family protein [Flavobacteriaceae bacterium S356]|uniref:DCC1-like thiol-disulfide oxidoreductase family protein n=1 Tax=Asprobacillus argus TaxID=3076534 RepID=A0ABU3LFR7_9FLAO|nr:DCC1-like thiol-disulfide oxidoreductase family protein [Flavobacteriaceae bacterium S356]
MDFDLPKNKLIVLFDGVCNLCNDSVVKIIKNDKNDVFRFTSLQSETGSKIIEYLGIDTTKVDSIVLYDPKKAYYIKSEAALKILNHFNGFWKLFQVFALLPNSFNNIFYAFIAKNRYKWFGRKESCMIPTPELKVKFLD